MAAALSGSNEEVREASDRLARAKRDLEEAREALAEERRRHNRLRSALERSTKHVSQVRSTEADVRRREEEARRQAEEARRWSQRKLDQPGQTEPEQSRFRLDAEASRLGSRLTSMEAEMDRRAAEVRRGETALRSTADRIRSLGSDIEALERHVMDMDQNVSRAVRRRGLATPVEASGPTAEAERTDGQGDRAAITSRDEATDPVDVAEGPAFDTLTITDRATVYLRRVLYRMSPGPGQLLRFIPVETGDIVLGLDIPREGDDIVSVGADSVLLVQAPLPAKLRGTTIDVRDSTHGPVLVLEPGRPLDG